MVACEYRRMDSMPQKTHSNSVLLSYSCGSKEDQLDFRLVLAAEEVGKHSILFLMKRPITNGHRKEVASGKTCFARLRKENGVDGVGGMCGAYTCSWSMLEL